MKKNRVLLLFLIFAIGCLSINVMAYTANEHARIARKAAWMATKIAMREISPGTGKDPDYELDEKSIKYDSCKHELEFHVTLMWKAKDRMLFPTRDTCKTWGKIYVDLSNGESGMKARYIYEGSNDWCQYCIEYRHLDLFTEPLCFDVQ